MQNNKKNDMIKDSVFDNFINFNNSKKKDPKPRLTVLEDYHIKKFNEKLEEGLTFYINAVGEKINKKESWENIDIGLYLNNRIRPILESVWSNGWDEGSKDVQNVINNAKFNNDNIVEFASKDDEIGLNDEDVYKPSKGLRKTLTRQYDEKYIRIDKKKNIKEEYSQSYLQYRFENIINNLNTDVKKTIMTRITEYISDETMSIRNKNKYEYYPKTLPRPTPKLENSNRFKDSLRNLVLDIGGIIGRDRQGDLKIKTAEKIVATELTAAFNIGTLNEFINRGVKYVRWRVDREHYDQNKICKKCVINFNKIGNIDPETGIKLSPGTYTIQQCLTDPNLMIPLHPYCKCWLAPNIYDPVNNTFRLEKKPTNIIDKMSILLSEVIAGAVSSSAAVTATNIVQNEITIDDKKEETKESQNNKNIVPIIFGATSTTAAYFALMFLLGDRKKIISKSGLQILDNIVKPVSERGGVLDNIDTPTVNINKYINQPDRPSILPQLEDVKDIIKDPKIQEYLDQEELLDDLGIPITIPLVLENKESVLVRILPDTEYEELIVTTRKDLDKYSNTEKDNLRLQELGTIQLDDTELGKINENIEELRDLIPDILAVSHLTAESIPKSYIPRLHKIHARIDELETDHIENIKDLKSSIYTEGKKIKSLELLNINHPDIQKMKKRQQLFKQSIEDDTLTYESELEKLQTELKKLITNRYSNNTAFYYEQELKKAIKEKNKVRLDELLIELSKTIGDGDQLSDAGILDTIVKTIDVKLNTTIEDFLLIIHRKLYDTNLDYREGRIKNIFDENGQLLNHELANSYKGLYNLEKDGYYFEYFNDELKNIQNTRQVLQNIFDKYGVQYILDNPTDFYLSIDKLHRKTKSLEVLFQEINNESLILTTNVNSNLQNIITILNENKLKNPNLVYRSNVGDYISNAEKSLSNLQDYINQSELSNIFSISNISKDGELYYEYSQLLPFMKELQKLRNSGNLTLEYLRRYMNSSYANYIIDMMPKIDYIIDNVDSYTRIRNSVRQYNKNISIYRNNYNRAKVDFKVKPLLNIGQIKRVKLRNWNSRLKDIQQSLKLDVDLLRLLNRMSSYRKVTDTLHLLSTFDSELEEVLLTFNSFKSGGILRKSDIMGILSNKQVRSRLTAIDRADLNATIEKLIKEEGNFMMYENIINLMKRNNIASFNNKLEYYKNNSLKEFVRSKLKTRFKFY